MFAVAFGLPEREPYVLGIVGATYTAFGVCAALGLRAPTRFAPLFLLQLLDEALWLAFVFAPRALTGAAPGYAWLLAAVLASYVVLDLVALPFARLAAPDEPPTAAAKDRVDGQLASR